MRGEGRGGEQARERRSTRRSRPRARGGISTASQALFWSPALLEQAAPRGMLCTALYTASSRPRKGGAPRKEEKSRGGGKVRGLDRDRMSAPAPSRLKKRIGTPRGWRASSLRGPSRDAGRVPTRGARPRRDTSERPRGGRDAVSARARARMPGASCTAGARFTDQAGYCVLQAAAVLKLAPACPTSRGAESERKREQEEEEQEEQGEESQPWEPYKIPPRSLAGALRLADRRLGDNRAWRQRTALSARAGRTRTLARPATYGPRA
ncbi:unnamed protein product [Prorocentrum cordatum]|uniref:Uncharacterized protein n=1 Tax=Prorocentrum cordatum TaxID=2364126 RepID=A0ABN9RU84_9DINO|nr:unnamed protein product [Polarella glacialis]